MGRKKNQGAGWKERTRDEELITDKIREKLRKLRSSEILKKEATKSLS